jgi:hypothetical protein
MRRAGTAIAAIVALCAGVLVGCDGGSAAGPSPTTSGSPSGSGTSSDTTTPTTPTADTTGPSQPPEMPALAREQSRAGAKAFVRHYVDVLNYSWVSMDPRLLTEFATPSCTICHRFSEIISRAGKHGGFQHGGQWSVQRAYGLPSVDPDRLDLLVTVQINAGRWRPTASDPVQTIERSTVTNQFSLQWVDGVWLVRDVRAT